MFHNQETTPNKLKHLELLERWEKENPDLIDTNKNNYINKKFFEFVTNEYKYNRNYKDEFGSCIDLMVRHNLANHQWLSYSPLIKDDLYSNAVYRCFNYAINTFDSEKGSAFVYFNSAIKNGFKEVINKKQLESDKASKLQCDSNMEHLLGNVQPKDLDGIKESFYDRIETKSKIDEIEDSNEREFYNMVMTTYEEFMKEYFPDREAKPLQSLKLLEEENVPRFKRNYLHYDKVIPLEYKEIKSTKKKIPRVEIERGICLQYLNQKTDCERNGGNKTNLQKKAILARKHGHQFFSVFSQQWFDFPGSVKEKLKTLLYNMYIGLYDGRNLMFDCISYQQIQSRGVYEPSFYLLNDDYNELKICTSQSVDDYLTWLKENKEASRIYDAGILKVV